VCVCVCVHLPFAVLLPFARIVLGRFLVVSGRGKAAVCVGFAFSMRP